MEETYTLYIHYADRPVEPREIKAPDEATATTEAMAIIAKLVMQERVTVLGNLYAPDDVRIAKIEE